MEKKKCMILSLLLVTFLHINNACQIDDHTLWTLPMQRTIDDVFEGIVFSRDTTDIEAVHNVIYGQATIGGPYFDLAIENSQFVVRTNAEFRNYEEIEVAMRVSMTVEFRCTGGGTRGGLIVWVDINDTNNNAPRFIPDEFEFIVTPPLPPGFLVTGCINEITARDIDLTTQRIDFTIEDNPYFEIEYDEESSTEPKEFKAQLRTKTFVRSLSEPLILTITATDVDETNDPRLSNSTTVRIVADSEFQFPEELVFGETFYLSNYTEDHQLNLFETISLKQGYDEYVNFTLEGEYYLDHFTLNPNGNRVSIGVNNPLPVEVWSERQIYLVVKAEREFTSGDSATVIVQLPEEVALQFENAYYEGSIINNGLQLSPLVLSQGYEGVTVSAEVIGELSPYFNATVQGQLVTLTMTPLMDDIIENNSFISLQVVISSDRSSASTVVNLEIIKDDNVTPVFDKLVYNGTYDPVTGLDAEQITFVQGFDETVNVGLVGEYADYFQTNPSGSVITLTSSTIPPELFSQQSILISIEATKPRTVGANAAIHIALPAARELEFEESTYRGTIEGNIVSSLPNILLHRGYEEGVSFSLSGEHSDYFNVSNIQDQVFIELSSDLPDNVITHNNVIMLTLTASALNAITTSTSVLLEIIKDDTTTPVFNQNIYYGTYNSGAFYIEDINLVQGFDSSVSFSLDGAHAQYFSIDNIESNVVITLRSGIEIPDEVIFNEKTLLFNVLADKALTVGAHAAILIRFPTELTDSAMMRFSQNTYVGTLDENEFQLESIVLETGFAIGTEFLLSGDYAEHFALSDTDNLVEISSLNTLPNEVVENNDFLVLELEARRQRAVSVWTSIIIDIVKKEVIAPVFSQAYYTGIYTEENGLTFEEVINLSEGYDETVTFALSGNCAYWFDLEQENNNVSLVLNSSVPAEVLQNNSQLLFTIIANKPNGIIGRAVISIDLPKDFSDTSFRFQQDFYKGYIENGNIVLDEIILEDYTSDVSYNFSGDYADYFQLTNCNGTFVIQIETPLPTNITEEVNIFIFTLEVESTKIKTHTVIIVENIKTKHILGFDRVTYLGSIENDQANIPPITLSEGFTQDVDFTLHGELAEYFHLSPQGAVVTVTLKNVIPEELVPANRITLLEIQAIAPQAITAYASIVIEHVMDDHVSPVVELIFTQTFYSGSYAVATGLAFPNSISLSQGYASNVEFALDGDNAQWFGLQQDGNSVSVALTSPIPAAVLANNQQLVFVVTARSPTSATARATVIISLIDEFPEGSSILGFDRVTYLGSIENDQANIPPITLSEGFTQDVDFTLHGELAEYFHLSPQGAVVTVTLKDVIPEELVPANRITLLEIQAIAPQAITAYASIVIEHVMDDHVSPVVELIFTQTFYSGSYAVATGLAFPNSISLSQGYASNVEFALEGDNAQWFGLQQDGNSVSVALTSPIPAAVLANNQQLVFVVTARSPTSATARATVIISLIDEFPEGSSILGFDRVTYLGSIENDQANIPPITLSEGFTQDVDFTLHGELAEYFHLSPQGAVVTVTLKDVIPEELVPANRITLLEIQAIAPQAITAYASIVIEHVMDDHVSPVVELIFTQTFYSGSYAVATGLAFPNSISLSQGYASNVEFALEGDNAQWFGLQQDGNSVSVALTSPIPAAVLANNQQLVFVVTARSPTSATARATVIISLIDEFPEGSSILGFDRVTYLGSIENNQANIPPITLSEGFTQDVDFTLHGELAEYFHLSPQGAVVTVTLKNVIPEELVPANRITLLEIQAIAPQAITAYASIVIEHVMDDHVSPVVELIFTQTFYSGSYAVATGLAFSNSISLSQGYASNVEFALEGDNAQWFGLQQDGNSVSVALTSPIPAAVLANNQQLVFVVTARSPTSATARATVIISLIDEFPEGSSILGFDRVTYLGSIENDQANIPPITLSEGFTQDVDFTLHGELAEYFHLSPQGAVVTVTLKDVIPEELVPANRITLLEIQAIAPQAITAYASIVIEHVMDDHVSPVVELIFTQTFYSGSYAVATGLAFPNSISLSQGYASNVEFALEGDNAQWFGLQQDGNSVSVALTSPIPAAVLANNQQLVFVVTARSPTSATARATVIISLIDEFPEGSSILGFDRVTYLGSIENDQANIPPITLSEGFTQDVDFTLHGELAEYFHLSPQGAVVTVTLKNVIPEELVPANRITLLEIQAIAPQAITAYASIVIEHVMDDHVSPVVELIFTQTFYSGSYAVATGLAFPNSISLSQGYASNVEFALEGDNAQWFGLQQDGNSVSVALTSPIPAAVLANNQQLVFVVTARSPTSATARATAIISLIDEFPEGSSILGFDRVTYLGSIENNQANIPPITLSEGVTQDVDFTLHGELAEYFHLSPQGAVVTVTLKNVIPEELVPANRITLLEIQAIAPQAITAYASIVIEHVMDDHVSPVVELIFTQTFYSGSYAVATGLAFPNSISLSQGYASNVEFALEGDNAQWFGLQQDGNSVSVALTSPIPAAVLANNQQLVFVVTARSPTSATARATVIISLIDEFPEGSSILGFDRVTYLGSIENDQANIPPITLSEGFTQDVDFTLHGELAEYFHLSPQGAVVTVTLKDVIPEELVPANRITLLEIQAIAPQAITAYASIVIEHVMDDHISPVVELIFTQTFYSGSYAVATGLAFPNSISLSQGYASNVEFALEGDNAQWFGLQQDGNSVSLALTSPIPAAVLANNQQLVFVVTARSPTSTTARATVIISLIDEFPEGSSILGFDRVTYLGSIENDQANIPPITLSEGFTQDVDFTLHGELAEYFHLSPQGAVVTVTLKDVIPEELVPANRITLLEIQAIAPQAITAYASIVIEHVMDDHVSPVVELIFTQTFYSGSYAVATGLAFPNSISLSQGYASNVEFALEGDNAQWFGLQQDGNSVSVALTSPIPAAVLANNQQLVFVVTARSPTSATARATVVISIIDESNTSFDKIIYEGIIQNGIVDHERITITGFSGSNVELYGEYEALFESELSEDVVTVTWSGSLALPTDVSHVVLELRAGTAAAVLLLNVLHTDVPSRPTVTFSSPSYAVRVDVTSTGVVGQVQASADNGEAVTYTLQLNNAHLRERLTINNEGLLHLSAPVNSGVHTFNVVATTVFTQTQGTATVHLSVETVTVCGDEYVIPPLIVLDVDEEEAHYDLINGTRYDHCYFTFTNRWPLEQDWIYVDERGLHTTEIDREHESIAFMPVSQVQVEVILHCQGDSTRVKRSLTSDALGPYDYGTNKWILTDTILYNSRSSFVNVIVNDINDNAPVFVNVENQPVVVGYPIPELAERVLPRSLVELQATDADIGENAALVYWSSAPQLAVAPSTGFVHLRDGAVLENGLTLTVHATDRNGHPEGLTGSIDILVRLLDENYIAVVTVRDAFLDDELRILSHLSHAVGYDIKVLRSVVISGEIETNETNSRKKRNVASAAGASLQMYVYGLIAREPVSVEQLTEDISTTVIGPVIIASSVSLQDHLEGQETCVIVGRDTGLLVATIILSVLLFIVLVLIAVWFFLRWRKNRDYDEFSDKNSLASRNESVSTLPNPEIVTKPRLDIAELKKSERRLQEMLDTPIQEVSVEPTSSKNYAILDMPTPEPTTPIVIQSIDKLKDAADDSSEDEFGESKAPKRKSMVTFNENVEKIIHVEDTPSEDLSEDPDYEVYKL